MNDETTSSNLVSKNDFNSSNKKTEKEIDDLVTTTTTNSVSFQQQQYALEQIGIADEKAREGYKERKRKYSVERRKELNRTWEILYEQVDKIESKTNDSNNNDDDSSSQKLLLRTKTYCGKKRKNVTDNRTELVERSIKLLKKMLAQNQENDRMIMNLSFEYCRKVASPPPPR